MRPDDRVRLAHMLEAVQEALSFARGRGRDDLDGDRMLVRALTKDIEIVGEAASRVSEETRAALSEIPWAAIIATRNRLIHAYFDINLDVLWETIAIDLPALEKALRDGRTAQDRPLNS
jgi:uncharacterized protein with HEPN domain